MDATRRQRWVDAAGGVAFGREPRQRTRAVHAALVLLMYAGFAVAQHVEVLIGLVAADDSWPLMLYSLAGALLFYGLVRSGLNLRIAPQRDPALTLPQSLWAVGAICWAYAISGPARGAIAMIMVPVLVFGVFSLTPLQARRLALLAFAALAGVMVWKGWSDPVRYDPPVEAMHLVFAAGVIASVSALAQRVGAMRSRLQQQKRELAEALARIQRLATRDELTGLTNRRAASERMREELALQARRRDQPHAQSAAFALVLIDIDHFKRVNDTLGHAAGDEVLRRFAAAAEGVLREGELLARWGGEEFMLLLPGTDAAGAELAAERLRERLARESFADLAHDLIVTFSAGVATCGDGDSLDETVARADRALYAAKHSGRDRVCRADRLPAPAV
jgi:diguanylate cyclase (GGDEF)-like protein